MTPYSQGAAEAIEAFRIAMQFHGLEAPALIQPGKLHRFSTNGKRGDDSGWCKLFDDAQGGVFGDFRTGLSERWQAKHNKLLTFIERAAFKRRCEQERQLREAEQARGHRQAAIKSALIWEAAQPATNEHPYLTRKNVKSHGVRLHNGALVIPIRNGSELYSLQFIDGEGRKRFLTGGRVAGCYFAIGTVNPAQNAGTLCIAEGFATGATIHQATEYPVAVAFNAGNLNAVARTLRRKFPDATLILCADDDVAIDGNPGLTKAMAAAVAVGAKLAIPTFAADRPEGATDFNDLAASEGIEAVARNIARTNPPPTRRTQEYERPIFYTKRNRALLRARFAFIPNTHR